MKITPPRWVLFGRTNARGSLSPSIHVALAHAEAKSFVGTIPTERAASGFWSTSAYHGVVVKSPLSVVEHPEGMYGVEGPGVPVPEDVVVTVVELVLVVHKVRGVLPPPC